MTVIAVLIFTSVLDNLTYWEKGRYAYLGLKIWNLADYSIGKRLEFSI